MKDLPVEDDLDDNTLINHNPRDKYYAAKDYSVTNRWERDSSSGSFKQSNDTFKNGSEYKYEQKHSY